MAEPQPQATGYQSRMRKSTRRLCNWHGAWAAATLLMAFGPGFFWHRALGLTLLAVGLDVAMGVGLVVGVPWTVMDAYRVIRFHANFGLLVVLQGLTFLVSFLYGTWRYR